MKKKKVISIRFIVTAVAATLITGTVIAVGSVAERNTRQALTRELHTRLALEARNVAILSSAALLTDYPELTLHPLVKDMQKKRPDLSMFIVLDHDGVVAGRLPVSSAHIR